MKIQYILGLAVGLVSHAVAQPYAWDEFVAAHGPMVPRDYEKRNYFAVHLDSARDIGEFVKSRSNEFENWRFEQPLGTLQNHYLFSVDKTHSINEHLHGINDKPQSLYDAEMAELSIEKREQRSLYKRALVEDGLKSLQLLPEKTLCKRAVPPDAHRSPRHKRQAPVLVPGAIYHPTDSSMEVVKQVMSDLAIADPTFNTQWHLINPLQPGHDLNVTGLWYENITGHGIAVAVVDDGLDMDHEDLKNNYFAEGSYDFNNNLPDPKPRLADDYHGTRCCGEIAAVKNDVCGVGIAYDAKVAGLRILSGQISEADEALAMNYAFDQNDIYSCSWGPSDDGRTMAEPGLLVKRAILNGVQNGRDKKGNIFVFASGNGAHWGDNCNFDGYTNSIYSITVAAIDRMGNRPFYSEACSANMIVTYSSGSGDAIHTTDIHGVCTDQHGGTSAAAPIAAGVFALVLSVRPELSWRDLQYLAMDTAIPVNEEDGSWQETAIGKKYSNNYGYGKLDAYAIVDRAKTWELVKPQAWFFADKDTVNKPIPSGEEGVTSTVYVSQEDLDNANLERLEHVNVLMNLVHGYRGALKVELISPSGVVSTLAENRGEDDSDQGYREWNFMSVAHWGEEGVGNWTIRVANTLAGKEQVAGTFSDWTLKLWGEAKDASKARLFSLDGNNYKEVTPPGKPSTSTESSSVDSTSSTAQSRSTIFSSTASTTGSRTTTATTATAMTTISPSPSSDSSASRPWSMIPTFGLSTRTLLWLYGSILLIVVFIAGITLYICIYRRNRNRRLFKRVLSTPTYEFDLIPHAEGDDEDNDSGIFSPAETESEVEYTDTESTMEDKRVRTAGKKVRNLYQRGDQAAEEDTGLFKVGSDEEDGKELSTSSGSTDETLHESKESQRFLD